MVYKDSAGKEIHEGDSLMDLTPGFVGEISEVFLDEDEDGRLEILKSERIGRTCDIKQEHRDRIIEELKQFSDGTLQQLERPDAPY